MKQSYTGFCFLCTAVFFVSIFGSGELAEFSVSAKRLKMVLVIMASRWDTSAGAMNFLSVSAARYYLYCAHGLTE